MRFVKVVALAVVMVVMAVVLTGCAVVMPIPSIKEAKFDFSVTYEVDGLVKTFTGKYVCEFEGTYKTLAGEGRRWKGYVENYEDNDFCMVAIDTNEDGTIYIDLDLMPEYYMADPDWEYYGNEPPEPILYIVYHSDDPDITGSENEGLYEKYGVRILSYDYPEPIENEYKNKMSWADFEFTIN
jgi:hypothetical protein